MTMPKRLHVLYGLLFFLVTSTRLQAQESDVAWLTSLQTPRVQRAALDLSRRAATQFLTRGIKISPPSQLPNALQRRAGVFVTIEKRGQIAPRGCRGTLQPITDTLAQEIIRNTIAACTRDAAQAPLKRHELAQCLISLTIVTRLQPITSLSQHDPKQNGLVAQNGSRVGVILPYEGNNSATQLQWAKRKAGLKPNASVQLFELFAARFREK